MNQQANMFPELSTWLSCREIAGRLGIKMDRFLSAQVGGRARKLWIERNGTKPRFGETSYSHGKKTALYPPTFFRFVDEIIYQEQAVVAVSSRKWVLGGEGKKVKKIRRIDKIMDNTNASKSLCRGVLVIDMREKFGMDDFQIAHTYVKNRTGVDFIVPGSMSQPAGLAEAAHEYISNYRGYHPGPLIARLCVRPSVDKNEPVKVSEIQRIIDDTKKKLCDAQEAIAVAAKPVASEDPSVPAADTEQREQVDRAEPLTSISVPRALLNRMRRMSLDASEEEGRHVPSYEIIERMTSQPKVKDQSHFDNIREWAHVRNITIGCTVRDQFLKLTEEVGELAQAIAKDDDSSTDFVDAIGDCVVVLTILADQYGTTIERCIEHAWNEIKDRKGRVINGTWVKES